MFRIGSPMLLVAGSILACQLCAGTEECLSASQKSASALLQVTRNVASTGSQHITEESSVAQIKRHAQSGNSTKSRAVGWDWVRPDPWNCGLLQVGDPRERTCPLPVDQIEGLKPESLDCGRDGTCNIEHANAFRTLQPVGALPCCPTPPFCGSPPCNPEAFVATGQVCTKRNASENLAYMKMQEVWPAYHGFGGAFELDIAKIFDTLGQPALSGNAGGFDLAIDMGANTGYYTEKMTIRKFAKNYIMIEAAPSTVDILKTRWGNDAWLQRWFTEQVSLPEGEPRPNFEIINQALSNGPGVLDLCQTEWSLSFTGCNVSIASVDSIIPSSLTPGFQAVLQNAQTAFIKVDTEGMDELVLKGMTNLLNEQRGVNEDGTPRFLVNFLQFEYSPLLKNAAKAREGFPNYDLKTVTEFLESVGFESFLIGPRFLPLSHGSWDDEFARFTEDPVNNMGRLENYPNFDRRIANWCYQEDCTTSSKPSFTSDVFAIRATHPRAADLKVALGACQESSDFDPGNFLRLPTEVFQMLLNTNDPRYAAPA